MSLQNMEELFAMPLFNGSERCHTSDVVNDLRDFWHLSVTDIQEDKDSSVFTVDGETLALVYLPVPVPWDDIARTASYAYNWLTAERDLATHGGHAMVTVISAHKSSLYRHILFSKVLCAILRTSTALGIYQGSQSLLLPSAQYLAAADRLKQDEPVVSLWVYIGLVSSETGNAVYTYGLTGFDKKELEIVESTDSLEEIYGFLLNCCRYIIGQDVHFKPGDTLGYTNEQQMLISGVTGQFVEGEVLRLAGL